MTIAHITVSQRLKRLGMTKKADVCPSRIINEKNILHRVMIYESLLKLNSLEPFLKRVISQTGDEK